jgi:hypothetical protein
VSRFPDAFRALPLVAGAAGIVGVVANRVISGVRAGVGGGTSSMEGMLSSPSKTLSVAIADKLVTVLLLHQCKGRFLQLMMMLPCRPAATPAPRLPADCARCLSWFIPVPHRCPGDSDIRGAGADGAAVGHSEA